MMTQIRLVRLDDLLSTASKAVFVLKEKLANGWNQTGIKKKKKYGIVSVVQYGTCKEFF